MFVQCMQFNDKPVLLNIKNVALVAQHSDSGSIVRLTDGSIAHLKAHYEETVKVFMDLSKRNG